MENKTREAIGLKREVKEAREYSRANVNTTREPLLVLNKDLIIISASKYLYTAFELDAAGTEGRLIYELDDVKWELPELRTLFESILPEKKLVTDYKISLNCSTTGLGNFLVNANILNRETKSEDLILLCFKEVTKPLQTQKRENKLELGKEIFSLNDLVTETVQDINYTNTQYKIEIFHNFKCNVYADKDRVGQVLINFITNAIKYSPEIQKIKVEIDQAEGKLKVIRGLYA